MEKLISSPSDQPSAYICDECVTACNSILEDERHHAGRGWTFSRFPNHRFPRLELGWLPTPIHEMPRLREALGGGPQLFIKHDDYTGPAFGGNKVRKLEFELAAAQAEKADVILTVGGVRSNHARATAAAAAKLGFECHLILSGDSSAVPASLWLDDLYGGKFTTSTRARIAFPS